MAVLSDSWDVLWGANPAWNTIDAISNCKLVIPPPSEKIIAMLGANLPAQTICKSASGVQPRRNEVWPQYSSTCAPKPTYGRQLIDAFGEDETPANHSPVQNDVSLLHFMLLTETADNKYMGAAGRSLARFGG